MTIIGGVVLGYPANVPAIPFATAPNLYGTARFPEAGITEPSLLSTLTLTINPSSAVTSIEGLLFNGVPATKSCFIHAFSGAIEVDSESLLGLPGNLQSGFAVFRLNSGGAAIDRVTISPELTGVYPGNWDFFIDTLAVNERIENVPEAASLSLLAIGCGILASRRSPKDMPVK